MIEMITFDFWQTLLADTPEGLAAAHAVRLSGVGGVLRRAGHPVDPEALEAGDVRARRALDVIWDQHRDVSPAEQIHIFLAAIAPSLPDTLSVGERDAIAAAYAAPVLTYGPVVSPGAGAAIGWLRERGVTIGVISNTGRTPGAMLRRLLARAGVLDGFRILTFSDEVGVRKPAPEIFHRTLAAAGVKPGAAVHIGDDPVNDVAGARGVGMRAIHYVPDGRPPAELAHAGLRHFADLPALFAALV